MSFLIPILLLLLSVLFSAVYIHYAYKKRWLDIPNHRSSHIHDTPRGGGVVFVLLWMLTSFFFILPNQLLLILLPGTLIVAIVGFLDDRYCLSVKYRTFAYLIAAIMSVYFLGGFTQFTISSHLFLSLPMGSLIAV